VEGPSGGGCRRRPAMPSKLPASPRKFGVRSQLALRSR